MNYVNHYISFFVSLERQSCGILGVCLTVNKSDYRAFFKSTSLSRLKISFADFVCSSFHIQVAGLCSVPRGGERIDRKAATCKAVS